MDKLDNYFVGYHLFSTAMKYEDINEGLKKSLYLIKLQLNADDVILFKKNEGGVYLHYSNQAMMITSSDLITIELERAQRIIEKDRFVSLKIDNDILSDIMFIHIPLDTSSYILAINNIKEFSLEFISIIKECLTIILNKIELHKKMRREIGVDTLTRLDNRVKYEIKMTEIDNNNEKYIFAIFDLLGLKQINDDFSHSKGDEYIQKATGILQKLFPKVYYYKEQNGLVKKDHTGLYLYRIGGDEFVLISSIDNMYLMKTKIELATTATRNINLGLDNSGILGLNYGIIERLDRESAKSMYLRADDMLKDDKRRVYQKIGINRRR